MTNLKQLSNNFLVVAMTSAIVGLGLNNLTFVSVSVLLAVVGVSLDPEANSFEGKVLFEK